MDKPIDKALSDVMALAKAKADNIPELKYEPKKRSPVGDRIIQCGESAALNYEKQIEYLDQVHTSAVSELRRRAAHARQQAIEQANEIDKYLNNLRIDANFDVRQDNDQRHDASGDAASRDRGSGINGGGQASVQPTIGEEHNKPRSDLPTF